MTKEQFTALYGALIRLIVEHNVSLREDMRVPCSSPFQFKPNPPRILVYRLSQPTEAWVDDNSNNDRISLFIERSGYNLTELVGVAHEFGHSRSPDSSIDILYENARQSGCLGSEDEKNRLLGEEKFAWSEARKVLSDLGFTDWALFCAQEISCITSYLAIPVRAGAKKE